MEYINNGPNGDTCIGQSEQIFQQKKRMLESLDALMQRWLEEGLLYVFPPWAIIGRMVQRIEAHRGFFILIALDWPRHPWYANLVLLHTDQPWGLPGQEDWLTQGPLHMPPVDRFSITAWL